MKNNNICKIIPISSLDKLETHKFIYETNINTMKNTKVLTHNRAILVKNGEITFNIDNIEFKANKGTLLFIFEGEKLYDSPENGSEYLYIDFSGNRSDTLFKRFQIHPGSRKYDGFDGIIPLWMEALVHASDENIDLASESILIYTISRLNSKYDEKNTIIKKIIEITEDDFHNPDLSISIIANKLNYNPKYISHLFKKKMGIGYTEYLRLHRLKYAITLIEHGIDSVKNLASLCGFANPQYFSIAFKETIGVSPSDYKNNSSKI